MKEFSLSLAGKSYYAITSMYRQFCWIHNFPYTKCKFLSLEIARNRHSKKQCKCNWIENQIMQFYHTFPFLTLPFIDFILFYFLHLQRPHTARERAVQSKKKEEEEAVESDVVIILLNDGSRRT